MGTAKEKGTQNASGATLACSATADTRRAIVFLFSMMTTAAPSSEAALVAVCHEAAALLCACKGKACDHGGECALLGGGAKCGCYSVYNGSFLQRLTSELANLRARSPDARQHMYVCAGRPSSKLLGYADVDVADCVE